MSSTGIESIGGSSSCCSGIYGLAVDIFLGVSLLLLEEDELEEELEELFGDLSDIYLFFKI
jgi:hypothetical protein